jgi:hypothetical protein
MESSGAKKSNHLGAFTFSYNLSSTKTESILFQSIFSGSIAEKKKKKSETQKWSKIITAEERKGPRERDKELKKL